MYFRGSELGTVGKGDFEIFALEFLSSLEQIRPEGGRARHLLPSAIVVHIWQPMALPETD